MVKDSVSKTRFFTGLWVFVFLVSPPSLHAQDLQDCEGTEYSSMDEIRMSRAASITSQAPDAPTQVRTDFDELIDGDDEKIDMIGCKRKFVYQERAWPVDSLHKQDGERLRPFIREVPSAVSELNTYQENRRSVSTAAYLGTAGLVLAITGLILGGQLEETNPQKGSTLKNIGLISGIGLAGGAVVYSFAVLRTNEAHLATAVENYNAVHKEDPIKLQFSTGILF